MMRYQGQTVLVTGATGFIAGRLAERLVVEEGAHVRVLVRNWSNAAWLSRVRVEFVEGDVTRPESLARAFAGCSRIFHCASGGRSYDEYMTTNVEGTRNMLEAAELERVARFVYISSIAVHGAKLPDVVDETTPFALTGRGYSDSKVEAEKLIWKFSEERRFPVVVVRPTYVWGPRAGQFTVGPVNSIANNALRLIDEGAPNCPAVFVDNLVDLLMQAGAKEQAVGEAFLATDGQAYSWRDFFEAYRDIVGAGEFRSLSSRSPIVRFSARSIEHLDRVLEALSPNPAPLWRKVVRRSARIARAQLTARGIPTAWYLNLFSNRSRINTDKAKRLLGHTPRFTLQSGMAATETWLKDQFGWQLGLSGDMPCNCGRVGQPVTSGCKEGVR